jgi:hypothetical protein
MGRRVSQALADGAQTRRLGGACRVGPATRRGSAGGPRPPRAGRPGPSRAPRGLGSSRRAPAAPGRARCGPPYARSRSRARAAGSGAPTRRPRYTGAMRHASRRRSHRGQRQLRLRRPDHSVWSNPRNGRREAGVDEGRLRWSEFVYFGLSRMVRILERAPPGTRPGVRRGRIGACQPTSAPYGCCS